MTTTSYKISKQLAEAGFEAGTDTLIHDPKHPITGERYASFCFETILEALPDSIHDKENCSSEESLELTKNYIQYSSTLSFNYYRVNKQENESLADTAARLWLKLKKKGLI
jgi:hypothetical protein